MNHLDFLNRTVTLHIPDGFLNLNVALFFWVLSIAMLAIAARRTRGQLGERQVPQMGMMAAFIFAAQMINFPVAGGTSGHLIGGAFTAIVLGPWAGMLVMATVIGVQALVFQDGGLIVMGANIFNMGLLPTAIGYGLYRWVIHQNRGIRLGVAGVAAWLSVIAGALVTSIQLWLSGTSALRVVFPTMLGVHFFIGIGETLITVAALAFIIQTRPDILLDKADTKAGRGWIAIGILVSLAVLLISPLASVSPDGLERVAIDLGFIDYGLDAPYKLLPDYTIPLLGETSSSTIIAGAIGLLLVVLLVYGMVWLLSRPQKT